MAKEKEEKKENRSSVLNAINTPLQLGGLVALIVEGLLAYLLTKANPKDVPLYVSMMVGLLIVTLIPVLIIEWKRIQLKESVVVPATGEVENAKKKFVWDVFLAAPMAALNNEEFIKSNSKLKEIKKVLEVDCNFKKVFYAGTNMETINDFQTADISIETDVDALKDSQYFIMIYPEKIVTSVLYEAGMALALGKPSFYFGHIDNFPFLMKQANQKFNHVKIYEADNLDKIINIIKTNRNDLFNI